MLGGVAFDVRHVCKMTAGASRAGRGGYGGYPLSRSVSCRRSSWWDIVFGAVF